MRGMKIIGALVFVGLLLALAFVQVEVKPFDEHEGAVAYAHPTLTTTYSQNYAFAGSLTDGQGFQPMAGVVATVGVAPIAYVAPTPVKKSLFDSLFPGSLFDLDPDPDFGDPIQNPGGSCTLTSTRDTDFEVVTRAKFTVRQPTGSETVYETEPETWVVKQTRDVYSCSDGIKVNVFQRGPTVEYEVGTYYFTNGYGDYVFGVEIINASDAKIGSGGLNVALTPDSLGGV